MKETVPTEGQTANVALISSMIVLPFFELKLSVCQLSLGRLGCWREKQSNVDYLGCMFSDLSSHLQQFQLPVSGIFVLPHFEHAKTSLKFQRRGDPLSSL